MFVRVEKIGFTVWGYEVVYKTIYDTEHIFYRSTAYSARSATRRGNRKMRELSDY